jgi:hypothetical protein
MITKGFGRCADLVDLLRLRPAMRSPLLHRQAQRIPTLIEDRRREAWPTPFAAMRTVSRPSLCHVGIRNANDAISNLQIEDGSANNISTLLQVSDSRSRS